MDLIILVSLLALGYGFGRFAELRHYRSIMAREEQYRSQVPVFAARFPPESNTPPRTQLVGGSVVVSVDYFKRFVAGLRQLVGGRVTSYENLLDRGRREALLRMREQALELGAESVFNVKLETASISKGRRDSIGSIEVYAYGTALIPAGRAT